MNINPEQKTCKDCNVIYLVGKGHVVCSAKSKLTIQCYFCGEIYIEFFVSPGSKFPYFARLRNLSICDECEDKAVRYLQGLKMTIPRVMNEKDVMYVADFEFLVDLARQMDEYTDKNGNWPKLLRMNHKQMNIFSRDMPPYTDTKGLEYSFRGVEIEIIE